MAGTSKYDFILEFIESYRSLPALWDTKRDDYSNRVLREHQYTQLLDKYRQRYPTAGTKDVRKKINILRTTYKREVKRLQDLDRNGAAGVDECRQSSLFYFEALSFLKDVESPSTSRSTFQGPKQKRKRIETASAESQVACETIANVWGSKLLQMDGEQRIIADKLINDIMFNGQLGFLDYTTYLANLRCRNSNSTPPYQKSSVISADNLSLDSESKDNVQYASRPFSPQNEDLSIDSDPNTLPQPFSPKKEDLSEDSDPNSVQYDAQLLSPKKENVSEHSDVNFQNSPLPLSPKEEDTSLDTFPNCSIQYAPRPLSNKEDFKNCIGMNKSNYEQLLNMVGPFIYKRDTIMREAIPIDLRLSTTLRFLATGNSFEDLKFISAVSSRSVARIVFETCEAIILSLKEFIAVPDNPQDWQTIADSFNRSWNFPNCLGAVGGIHVAIKKPPGSGSFYYNHKKFFSVVLMAVVNAEHEFLAVDVGINGRVSDGDGVLQHTAFGKAFYKNNLNIPEDNTLPHGQKLLPYVFLGDDAFQLTENFMKPFSTGLTQEQKIFNYRLSHAHRVVERTFGILSSRFGIFRKPIQLSPDRVQVVVLACCYLHNFLRRGMQNNSTIPDDDEANSEEKKTFLVPLQTTLARNSTDGAKNIREEYMHYFNNEGQVSC